MPGPILGGAPGALFINIAAPCPAGGIALGGGYTISGTVHVSSSIASDFQQGWQITVDNPGEHRHCAGLGRLPGRLTAAATDC